MLTIKTKKLDYVLYRCRVCRIPIFVEWRAKRQRVFSLKTQQKLQKSYETENTIKTMKCDFLVFFYTSFFDDTG